jgi:hypothetical protein
VRDSRPQHGAATGDVETHCSGGRTVAKKKKAKKAAKKTAKKKKK